MIILKVTKKQDFTLSLEDKLLEKPQGVNLTPSFFRVKINTFSLSQLNSISRKEL